MSDAVASEREKKVAAILRRLAAEARMLSENRIREMATAAGYAEDGPTFDPDGKYLCGTCTMRLEPGKCAKVTGEISMKTGSCFIYVRGAQLYDKPDKHRFSQAQMGYSERPNVKGFGCSRCEYFEDSDEPELGRKNFCGFWLMKIKALACCFANENPDDVKGKDDPLSHS